MTKYQLPKRCINTESVIVVHPLPVMTVPPKRLRLK